MTDPKSFWTYIFLTYAISWLFWIPAALSGAHYMEFPTILLYFFGGFGPSLAAVILVLRRYERTARRDFWRRTLDFRRISPGWYLLGALLFPALMAAALAMDAFLGGPAFDAPGAAAMLAQPATIFSSVLITLLLGPVSEELGWRGYALDVLQKRSRPLAASLIIGVFWWAWHLPLFSITGASQQHSGWFGLDFWIFFITIFPLSILFTWAYNHNRGSILLAIWLHFFYNFTFGLFFPIESRAMLIFSALLVGVVALLAATRPAKGFTPVMLSE